MSVSELSEYTYQYHNASMSAGELAVRLQCSVAIYRNAQHSSAVVVSSLQVNLYRIEENFRSLTLLFAVICVRGCICVAQTHLYRRPWAVLVNC